MARPKPRLRLGERDLEPWHSSNTIGTSSNTVEDRSILAYLLPLATYILYFMDRRSAGGGGIVEVGERLLLKLNGATANVLEAATLRQLRELGTAGLRFDGAVVVNGAIVLVDSTAIVEFLCRLENHASVELAVSRGRVGIAPAIMEGLAPRLELADLVLACPNARQVTPSL